jgi:hypothetical protein
MATSALHSPQLIFDSQMLYLVWIPADPAAVARMVPDGLTPAADGAVFMNQYVVPTADQTSNGSEPTDAFGSYSLTYLGSDLAGLDTEAGTPGRWWTHYFNSSEPMIRYAAERGVPASGGRTTLEVTDTQVVATTYIDGTPQIRSIATINASAPLARANGQLRYITKVDGDLVSGRYPFVMDAQGGFECTSIEFLDPSHEIYAFRPADPLQVTFGFYSPSITFCYPGGEGPLGSFHGS